MIFLLIISIVALVIGLGLLGFWFWQNRNAGVLRNKYIYADSEKNPGQILYSKTIALCGKPDYLIEEGGMVFPVEVKTGHTPSVPYLNHTSQLMAYCFLVEENYGVRPTGGYLRYEGIPKREFKIAYTDEARDSIKELVGEMLLLKHSGKEPKCNHPQHNR